MYFMFKPALSVFKLNEVKMRKKKRKLKYKNILLLVFIIIAIVLISKKGLSAPKEIITNDLVESFIGKKISTLEETIKDDNIKINKKHLYSNKYLKDEIMEVNYHDQEINVTVSKGKPDDKYYQSIKANELGNIPIMMYHGIVDTEENTYTGGNVDKNGYNRTAKAFREDLKFYYENGYRMIRLIDYVNGKIDVKEGLSPIILTFDDGDKNNFNVLGKNSDGTLKIDPNCAVGILEEFKKKYPDFNVTATFFVMAGIFNQSKYNEDILNWLIDHGYDIGNHTTTHPDFTTIGIEKTKEVVGKMYQTLDNLIPNKYVKIVALPFGSPYKKDHANYQYILKGEYNGYSYETIAALRVGWEPELSPFNKNFDKEFLKRCRAYDNDGQEFDITMVFKNLEKNRYISDGDIDTIVIKNKDSDKINSNLDNVIVYKESD